MRVTALLQRTLRVIGITALTILFFACPDALQIKEQQGKAKVTFIVADIQERTVLPQASLSSVASYRLLGGKTGAAETTLINSFTGSGTSIPLEPGTWNFTLDAYNSSGVHILQGKVQNKQINLTGSNQVSFSLSTVNSGTGDIQITLSYPVTANITRITVKTDTNSENFDNSNGNFVYSKNGVASGDYFYSFELYSGDKLRTVVSELVLVRSGLTSSKTIPLVGDDLKPLLTGTVSITGYAGLEQILTADTGSLGGSGAASSGGIGTIIYQWKRGTDDIGINSSTYVIQSDDVGFTITVIVTRSGYVGSVTSAPTAIVVAEAPPTPGLAFKLINGNTAYSVSRGTARASNVVIPALFEGLPVTTIAWGGFEEYTTNITNIKIPDSVTIIEGYAFADCRGLTSITIPDSVMSIHDRAFAGCSGLTSITVASGNTVYQSEGNCLIRISDNTLVLGCLTSIIPNGVTSIGNYAFASTGVTSVTIPDGVTSIGVSAFQGCTRLTSVTIPDGVTSIGYSAFYNCSGLTSVTIGNSVTSIGDRAFQGCSGLTSVTIPYSVKRIEEYAFLLCDSLKSVTFQGTLDVLYSSSFPGDLRSKFYKADQYGDGTPGTYTRESGSDIWTKI